MANGFTDEVEQGLLTQLLIGTPFADPTPVKVSLHTADPGNSGANEVTGGSYARVQVDTDKWTAPVSIGTGSASYNMEDLDFADMPETTVAYIGIWSNDGTTFLMSGLLDSGGTPVSGGATFTIRAGKLRAKLN